MFGNVGIIWYNNNMEILLTLIYAGIIGFYNIFKKLSVGKSKEYTILVLFTSVAFLLSFIWIPFGLYIPIKFVLILALKGFLLALSWVLGLKVLKSADISVATVTSVLSAVISFVLGIILFNESAGCLQIIGSTVLIFGVAAINLCNKESKGKITKLLFALLMISAMITTISHVIDKYTTTYLTGYQVQFWGLLFMCAFSWMFFGFECVKNKQFLISKTDLKNVWPYLVGIFLFVGDFFLFWAYKVPGSQMITISILSKLKIVVTVMIGGLIFKERNMLKKLVWVLVVLSGAVMISLA